MTHVEVQSINDSVILVIPGTERHQQRFVGMSEREAQDLVTRILGATESARGFKLAMDGGVKDPSYCPNCKARNITARHACKRVRS